LGSAIPVWHWPFWSFSYLFYLCLIQTTIQQTINGVYSRNICTYIQQSRHYYYKTVK